MQPISISVEGDPAPKGSMKAFAFRGKDGKHRVTMTNMLKTTKPWQERVAAEVRAAMEAVGMEQVDEPVKVQCLFFLRKGKSVKRQYPSVAPDLDKYQRAIGDALEGTLLSNDSRIVEWHCVKLYAETAPGVHINVSPYEGEK